MSTLEQFEEAYNRQMEVAAIEKGCPSDLASLFSGLRRIPGTTLLELVSYGDGETVLACATEGQWRRLANIYRQLREKELRCELVADDWIYAVLREFRSSEKYKEDWSWHARANQCPPCGDKYPSGGVEIVPQPGGDPSKLPEIREFFTERGVPVFDFRECKRSAYEIWVEAYYHPFLQEHKA